MSIASSFQSKVNPGVSYDQTNEAQFRQATALADGQNLKRGADVRGSRIILQSPDGTSYAIVVANGGALSTVAV